MFLKKMKIWMDYTDPSGKLYKILFMAFILRVVYFFIVLLSCGQEGFYSPDTMSYIIPAQNLLEEGTFTRNTGEYEIIRTPGYPLLLALCMVVAGEGFYVMVIFLQIFLNLVAILYLYRVAVMVFKSERAAHIVSLIAMLNPLDIRYTCQILTDSLTQTCILFCIYHFVKFFIDLSENRSSIINIATGSLFLSLAILLRPAIVYLPYAFILGFIVVFITIKDYKKIISAILIITIISIVPVELWKIRNQFRTDFSGYSAITSINIYGYNSAYVFAKQNNMNFYEAKDYLLQNEEKGLVSYLETMPWHEAYKKRGLEIIMSDLPLYLRGCLAGVACILFYPGARDVLTFMGDVVDYMGNIKAEILKDGGMINNVVGILSNPEQAFLIIVFALDSLLLLVCFIFAIIGILKNRACPWYVTALLLGIYFYMLIVCCQPNGYGSYPRFRLMISMITILYAAYGIKYIFAKISDRVKM